MEMHQNILNKMNWNNIKFFQLHVLSVHHHENMVKAVHTSQCSGQNFQPHTVAKKHKLVPFINYASDLLQIVQPSDIGIYAHSRHPNGLKFKSQSSVKFLTLTIHFNFSTNVSNHSRHRPSQPPDYQDTQNHFKLCPTQIFTHASTLETPFEREGKWWETSLKSSCLVVKPTHLTSVYGHP